MSNIKLYRKTISLHIVSVIGLSAMLADLGLIVFMAFIVQHRRKEIAVPVTWVIMSKWLRHFAYRTALSWWLFLIAGVSVLLICLCSVSIQSYNAASENPVEGITKT